MVIKILGTLVVGAMMMMALIQVVDSIYSFDASVAILWGLLAKVLLLLSGILFLRAIWAKKEVTEEKDSLEKIHRNGGKDES